MANIKAQIKSIRSSKRKRKQNDDMRVKYKSARKLVRDAVAAGDKKTAEENLPIANKNIAKAAKIGVLHKNTAARYVSRLTKQVNALSA